MVTKTDYASLEALFQKYLAHVTSVEGIDFINAGFWSRFRISYVTGHNPHDCIADHESTSIRQSISQTMRDPAAKRHSASH